MLFPRKLKIAVTEKQKTKVEKKAQEGKKKNPNFSEAQVIRDLINLL